MVDALQKIIYAGIGSAAIAAEKISEAVDELIKQGNISEKEGKELVKKYLEKAKDESSRISKTIED